MGPHPSLRQGVMMLLNMVVGVIALILLIYLFVALLKPEFFS